MKHIRKYNESNINTEIDKNFINSAFAEFVDDDDSIEIEMQEVDGFDLYSIIINVDFDFRPTTYLIDQLIAESDKMKDFFLDVKTCINRIMDEYPNLKYYVYFDQNDMGRHDEFFYIEVAFCYNQEILNNR